MGVSPMGRRRCPPPLVRRAGRPAPARPGTLPPSLPKTVPSPAPVPRKGAFTERTRVSGEEVGRFDLEGEVGDDLP
jgi:hypothetical protein